MDEHVAQMSQFAMTSQQIFQSQIAVTLRRVMERAIEERIRRGRENLKKIIERVKKRLKKKKECKALFDKVDPASYLNSHVSIGTSDSDGQPFPFDSIGAITVSDHDPATGIRLPSGTTVFNQNSWFLTGTHRGEDITRLLTERVREANGLGDLNLDEIRELGVLHELMHVNDTAGAYDDEKKAENSRDLNILIRSKCF